MLPVEKLRKIDPNTHLSDEEVLEIRDSLYDLGNIVFDDWLENGGGSKYPTRVLQKLKDSNKLKP